MNPAWLFAEVLVVIIANYCVAWLIAILVHATAAYAMATLIDRRIQLDERDRVTLWLTVVLLPPITAFLHVTWSGGLVPWSRELVTLGTAPGVAAVIAALSLGTVGLIAAYNWWSRARGMHALGPRRPARFPAVSLWQSLPARAGLRPRITRSDRLVAPLVVGDEEIVLPARTFGVLSLGEQRALLAHEQGHLRHRDPLWLGIGGMVARFCWFQPLARRAWQRAMEAAEFAADAHAVRVTGEPRDLATALASLAGALAWQPAGISAAGGRLEERIVRLVTPRESPRFRVGVATRFVALITLAALLLMAPGLHVNPDHVANGIPWLTPSKDPPNARMMALREYLRGRP